MRDTLPKTRALGPKWMARVVHAENPALEYQELHVCREMLPVYRQMMEIVRSLIARAFSSEVITPGKTTDQDVGLRGFCQKVNDMGFGGTLVPSVDPRIQRQARPGSISSTRDAGVVIERGDVLQAYTDFGITAMRLNTDTQHRNGLHVCAKERLMQPAGYPESAGESGKRLQDLVLGSR